MKKQIKVRHTWKFNPVERVVPSKKRYDRSKEKRELKDSEY